MFKIFIVLVHMSYGEVLLASNDTFTTKDECTQAIMSPLNRERMAMAEQNGWKLSKAFCEGVEYGQGI